MTNLPPERDPHRLAEPDKSLGDLIGRLTSDFGDLVTDHIDLAKAEIKHEVTTAGKGAGMLGAGAIAALVAVIMLSAAAAWGLSEVMAPGLAFLIVGAVWAAVAAGLAFSGKSELEDVEVAPRQTQAELRRDREWLKTQTN